QMEGMEVAEKLTMKVLSGELEVLRKSLLSLENGLERKLEKVMEKAAGKLKSRLEISEQRLGRLRVDGEAGVDVNARRRLIAETAYRCAERRGFTGGNQEQDWLDAEMEIDSLLLQGWTKNLSQQMTGQENNLQEESRV
ncbi:hypothetical protein MNBD_GAMMA13-1433, partial [hydrothermal vent metagenome]